jgi:hypothetical protein
MKYPITKQYRDAVTIFIDNFWGSAGMELKNIHIFSEISISEHTILDVTM